ncbi:MAG TPA: [Fe-Fe] hydrogenase large subunit C-terminal domain-containing protein [Bacteroidota bacterium]|nr:[Fe-Fe] hydrogenase large subunit C-terminal domain-containing protein [Bacteroidota bacterium]
MSEEFRSIRIDGEKCTGRMRCLRACPTQALRVRKGKATLLMDRCIDCGECVRVCPNHAFIPQTSSTQVRSAFKYTIALPSPVFYSQFGKDVRPAELLGALKRIGFDDAYDVACASESVSIAIQEYLDSNPTPRPLISPFCPAIVRLIQVRYPNLLDNLIPIESPMEIAAREAKRLKMHELGLREDEIGAIYLTPCPAKMISLKNPPRKKHSFLDGAVPISEIYPALIQALAHGEAGGDKSDIQGLGLGWPIVGGQVACLKAEDSIAIAGLVDVIRVFDELEHGRLKDLQYIECHSCPTACVGGSLTVEDPYVARIRVLRMVQRFGSEPCQDRQRIRALYRNNFFSLLGTIAPSPAHPLDADIARAIHKMQRRNQIYDMLPKIDCGACGAPTCLTFAGDVVRGDADTEECVFVTLKTFETMSKNLWDVIGKHSARIRSNVGSFDHDSPKRG